MFTGKATGELVPQPHGGALRNGGTSKGGPGRTVSEVRVALKQAFAGRMTVLEDIADGEAVQRARVPLLTVLPHATCPKCGTGLKAKDVDGALLIEVNGHVSASPADRMKALDLMAKYGIGTLKEVSSDDVRDKLRATLALLTERLGPEAAEPIIREMEGIWSGKR